MPKGIKGVRHPLGLTDKQERFCQEYIHSLNGSQAAAKAGYSQNGLRVAVVDLLANPNIQKRLGELAKLRPEMLINEVIHIAQARLTDVIEFDDRGVHVIPSNKLSDRAKASLKSIKIKRRVTTLRNGDTQEESEIEVTMHDKIAALEKLFRKFKMYPNDVPLLDAMKMLLNEGVASEEQALIVSQGLQAIEAQLKALQSPALPAVDVASTEVSTDVEGT